MRHQHAYVKQNLQRKIAVADAIHRIWRHSRKPELLRDQLAVYRMRRAGKRGGAQRTEVISLARASKALVVAAKHKRVS